MKKYMVLLAALLVLLLAVGTLASCGGSKPQESGTETKTETKTEQRTTEGSGSGQEESDSKSEDPEPKPTASEGLEYSENSDGTLTVKGIGTCQDTAIVIPSEHDGKKVTSICYYAFAGCESITSITIPDSVTSIGNSAFYGCTALQASQFRTASHSLAQKHLKTPDISTMMAIGKTGCFISERI